MGLGRMVRFAVDGAGSPGQVGRGNDLRHRRAAGGTMDLMGFAHDGQGSVIVCCNGSSSLQST